MLAPPMARFVATEVKLVTDDAAYRSSAVYAWAKEAHDDYTPHSARFLLSEVCNQV